MSEETKEKIWFIRPLRDGTTLHMRVKSELEGLVSLVEANLTYLPGGTFLCCHRILDSQLYEELGIAFYISTGNWEDPKCEHYEFILGIIEIIPGEKSVDQKYHVYPDTPYFRISDYESKNTFGHILRPGKSLDYTLGEINIEGDNIQVNITYEGSVVNTFSFDRLLRTG